MSNEAAISGVVTTAARGKAFPIGWKSQVGLDVKQSFGKRGTIRTSVDTEYLAGKMRPGLAVAKAFGTDTGIAVAEDGSWSVPRVVMTVDCGQVVNLDRARAQQEGAQRILCPISDVHQLLRGGKREKVARNARPGREHFSLPHGARRQRGLPAARAGAVHPHPDRD